MKQVSIFSAGIFLAAIIGLMTGVFACRQAGEKQAEKSMENILEQGSGEKTNVDIEGQDVTIESESGKVQIHGGAHTWPTNMPADIPEIKTGKIVAATTSETEEGQNWNVHYSNVGIEALDSYGAALKSKGFKIQTMKTPKGGMVNGEKGNLGVIFTVGEDRSVLVVMERKE